MELRLPPLKGTTTELQQGIIHELYTILLKFLTRFYPHSSQCVNISFVVAISLSLSFITGVDLRRIVATILPLVSLSVSTMKRAPPYYGPLEGELPTYNNSRDSSLTTLLNSVINRSPPELIKEIILVDDFSDDRKLNVV